MHVSDTPVSKMFLETEGGRKEASPAFYIYISSYISDIRTKEKEIYTLTSTSIATPQHGRTPGTYHSASSGL
jgi:hypothetical protein